MRATFIIANLILVANRNRRRLICMLILALLMASNSFFSGHFGDFTWLVGKEWFSLD